MADAQEDLQATSDSIQQDADRLEALEQAKQELDPRDLRHAEITGQVEELGETIRSKAAVERELSEELRSEG